MMAKRNHFEFASKQERNAFLRQNNLCIAGSLNSWPNVLNQNGEFVGDAFQRDGCHQIEIWEQFLHCVAELGLMQAAND
ncbi:MAG: hypothetical protein JRH20_21125 [Deltaproteobacteria bacterium]|nr:hypothetical protein [Deltaproteobacteria bacterium]